SAAATRLDDPVAVRQPRTHAHRPAFRMMSVPTIVMSAVIVPMNHNIVSIMNHNLRGRRDSAEEQCPHRRTQNDHSHLSLLHNPGSETRKLQNCFLVNGPRWSNDAR